MVRVLTQRATAWVAILSLLGLLGFCAHQSANAQNMVMASGPDGAQGGQMWVGQTPTYQVAPDGAVHLDQQMMAPGMSYGGPQCSTCGPTPYYAGQPMMAQQGAAPYAMQPQYAQPQYMQPQYAAPYGAQPWGTPVVQQQSAFGLPTSDDLTGGPIVASYIHRTSIWGEFLYIRPRDADVAYALPIDGPVAPVLGNEVPVGPVALVDPDYDIAFRAGFNIALDEGSSVAAQYTRIRSETADAVTVTAPTVLRSLVSHPLSQNAATDTLDASASLDIDLDEIDLDFRGLWYGCECKYAYAVNYIAGASWTRLKQDFNSNFETIGTTNVASDVDFDGIGMRLGLQGERFWPAWCLFVYGSGISNIMFGEFDASYLQQNSFNGTEAFTSWSAGRIVPVVDFEAGVGWYGVNRHLKLSAGYRVSTWFNVVKNEDFIWAAQNHDFRNLDGSLTFDGVVGRVEWLF